MVALYICVYLLVCVILYMYFLVQVERVIEDRARSLDMVKHKYYDLLYCFHTTKQNYRKGIYVHVHVYTEYSVHIHTHVHYTFICAI